MRSLKREFCSCSFGNQLSTVDVDSNGDVPEGTYWVDVDMNCKAHQYVIKSLLVNAVTFSATNTRVSFTLFRELEYADMRGELKPVKSKSYNRLSFL